MSKLTKFVLLLLPVVRVLLSAIYPLHAQVVTFTGPPVNLGNINTCGDKTAAGPCSATRTLTYQVTAGGMLGKPKILTQGAPNLDFTLAGGTCNGSVTTGASCTVQVKLTPRFAGQRIGAAQIVDQNGKVLATTFLRGVGVGPQAGINSGHPIALVTNPNANIPWSGVGVDGAGNVWFANGERGGGSMAPAVLEYPAGGGEAVTAATGFSSPQGVAIDGAGNLYVTDIVANRVIEAPPGCSSSICYVTLDAGFDTPYGVAVDGAGTVYVADSGNNRVVAMPSGCTTRACAQAVGSGLNFPYSVAVDGSGTVLIADLLNQRIVRVLAGGKQSTVAANLGVAYGVAVDAADDILITDYAHNQVVEEPAAGGAIRTLVTLANAPMGIAVDGAGDIFYTNASSNVALSELAPGQVPLHTFATTAAGTVSSDSPQNYTLQNIGNAGLSLNGLRVGPDDGFVEVPGAAFGPTDCAAGLLLAPGADCNLSLSFTPTVNSSLTGSAILTDNSLNATDASQGIPLAGIGGPQTLLDFSTGFGQANAAMELNGGSSILSNTLQLTDGGVNESRSAFFGTPIGLAAFAVRFDFQLRGKGTLTPDAEGFTFVLQANGPDALGSAGGGLGYGPPGIGQPGARITNSVAVKFDLHNNEGEGSNSIGVYLNGAAPTIPSLNVGLNDLNFHSGHDFQVALIYDGSVLNIFLSDALTHATVGGPIAIVDIPAILGGITGYAGFTGSTGASVAVENILDLQITSSDCCTAGMPDFSTGFLDVSGLTVNGKARYAGGALELTQDTAQEASSAWFSSPIPVSKFTSDFDFSLSRGDGEGFAFVLQSEGLHALGSAGAGLGYGTSMPGAAGAAIEQSVAVKFDLHSEAGEGSNSTGVYTGGNSPTSPSTNLAPSGINLHSGHTFHARLDYDGTLLSVNITDLTAYAVFSGSYPVAISAAVGGPKAYAGFTAATGDVFDTVKILNWHMTYY